MTTSSYQPVCQTAYSLHTKDMRLLACLTFFVPQPTEYLAEPQQSVHVSLDGQWALDLEGMPSEIEPVSFCPSTVVCKFGQVCESTRPQLPIAKSPKGETFHHGPLNARRSLLIA